MRILFVEDDADSAKVAAEILSHHGHRVSCVDCGREALRAARREPFDAAVVDVGLPDTDGLRVVAELRRIDATLHCVLVSGQHLEGGDAAARQLGAQFVPKPLDFVALERLLSRR